MKKVLFILILLKLLPCIVAGQQFFRIKADFSIKEKLSNGKSSLILGTVYYDRGTKKIVYDITFPRKEKWIIQDNFIYFIVNNKVTKKQETLITVQQSIFNIALEGKLADYGLKNTFYSISKVEKEGNMIISTWVPDVRNKKYFGKVVMSHINKKLNGIAFYTPKEEIASKQFFKNYINIAGCEFPSEVAQTIYSQVGKSLQLTTYKNISINAFTQSEMYNYPVPNY